VTDETRWNARRQGAATSTLGVALGWPRAMFHHAPTPSPAAAAPRVEASDEERHVFANLTAYHQTFAQDAKGPRRPPLRISQPRPKSVCLGICAANRSSNYCTANWQRSYRPWRSARNRKGRRADSSGGRPASLERVSLSFDSSCRRHAFWTPIRWCNRGFESVLGASLAALRHEPASCAAGRIARSRDSRRGPRGSGAFFTPYAPPASGTEADDAFAASTTPKNIAFWPRL